MHFPGTGWRAGGVSWRAQVCAGAASPPQRHLVRRFLCRRVWFELLAKLIAAWACLQAWTGGVHVAMCVSCLHARSEQPHMQMTGLPARLHTILQTASMRCAPCARATASPSPTTWPSLLASPRPMCGQVSSAGQAACEQQSRRGRCMGCVQACMGRGAAAPYHAICPCAAELVLAQGPSQARGARTCHGILTLHACCLHAAESVACLVTLAHTMPSCACNFAPALQSQ